MWTIDSSPHSNRVEYPQFFVVNSFNDAALNAFNRSVDTAIATKQLLYPISIESNGGDADILYGMLSIIDKARKRGVAFATVTNSRAYSAGALLWSYGNKDLRFVGDHASLMFHSCIIQNMNGKAPEVKNLISDIHVEQSNLFEKISKNLGKPKGWLTSKLKKQSDYDWFLTADAVEAEGLGRKYSPTFTLQLNEQYILQ